MRNTNIALILTLIPLISTFIVIVLWYIRGYDGRFKTKNKLYKLPDDLTTLDVGYLLKSEAKEKDVNSLILYLASKNYLRIEEIKDSYQLIKLKEYKKRDEVKIFFDELFKNGDNVIEDELVDDFYQVTDEIRHHKNRINQVDNNYYYNNRIITMIIDLIVIINLFLITTIVYVETIGRETNIYLVMIFLLFYLLTYLPLKSMNNITKYSTRVLTLIIYFFILIAGFDLTNEALIINLLINITLIIFMNTIILFMPKRNKAGHQALGQIKRFKKAIKDLDEKKLKELLNENKNYVFDIFPYAYVLGITRNLIDIYTKVDDKIPKYVKMQEEKDVRKTFKFLKDIANNLDHRYGNDYY